MKKKLLYIAIVILSCFSISALLEVTIFNHSADSIETLSYETKKSDEDTIYTIHPNGQYIKNLVIDYETDKKFEYSLSYTYNEVFGTINEKTIVDVFEKKLSHASLYLGGAVHEIKLTIPSTDDLKYTIAKEGDKTAKENHISIKHFSADNSFSFNYKRFFCVSFTLLIIVSLFYFYKTGFSTSKLHIYFMVLGSLLGFIFISAQPVGVFYQWDDQTHFERVVGFFSGEVHYTNGEYNTTDADIANSVGRDSVSSLSEQKQVEEYLNSDVDNNYTRVFSHYTPYGRLPYLPMAIGYHGAKLIGLPFTACFYIGRVFNLIIYILLMAYAIKKVIAGKLFLTVLALLPTNIFFATSYSYDPAVMAGVSIFIVHLINLFLDKSKKINFSTLLIMIASISFAALAKAPYALFLLLLLFVPKARFEKPEAARLIKTGAIAITALLLATLLLPSLAGNNISDTRGGAVSVKDQAILMIKNPGDFLVVLKNSAADQAFTKLMGPSTLSGLGYTGKLTEYDNLLYVLIILLIIVFITDNAKNTLSNKERWVLFGSSAVVILSIWVALYLAFTPVGLYTINGVQSRYFLPILFPLLFAIQPKKIKNSIDPKYYNAIAISVIVLTGVIMAFSIILSRYSL